MVTSQIFLFNVEIEKVYRELYIYTSKKLLIWHAEFFYFLFCVDNQEYIW